MFRILEIVHRGDVQLSNRHLPVQLPERAEAVEHIELLQAHFLVRGYDDKQDFWWARNDDAAEVYRWVIEDDTLESSA